MSVFQTISNRRPPNAALVALILVTCAGVAQAQVQEEGLSTEAAAASQPYALFQYATLTGSGNTLYATMIPVVTSSGTTIYKNLTLLFDLDASGNFTVAAGYPQVVVAPTPIVNGFKAGKYAGPSNLGNGSMMIAISGPGLTSGGATEWTLAATGTSGSTYPESAYWYVGSLTSNPLYTRIKAAGITSTLFSYGLGGSAYGTNSEDWFLNSLLGFSQVGNTITIVSFTDDSGKDHSQPIDQVTYTLSQ